MRKANVFVDGLPAGELQEIERSQAVSICLLEKLQRVICLFDDADNSARL